MNFLRKSGSLVTVWIKSLATAARCSFCSGSRSCKTNFATTRFMSRSCVKISDTVVFTIPRSASSSHTVSHQSLSIATWTRFNILRCSACCRPSRTWITFNRFSNIFEAFVTHFYLCCTRCIVPESLLNYPNSFCRGMFKLKTKFDADSLLCLLSHFEHNSHTVHMLTQGYLVPPLTTTVKLSLFMHEHPSLLFLAARLHQCRTNLSHYINNRWSFSGPSCVCVCVCVCVYHTLFVRLYTDYWEYKNNLRDVNLTLNISCIYKISSELLIELHEYYIKSQGNSS